MPNLFDASLRDEDKLRLLRGLWRSLHANDAAIHESPIAANKNDLELLVPPTTSDGDRSDLTPPEVLPLDVSVGSASLWQAGSAIGEQLRILSCVGAGGMGEVYVAWHGLLECEVAVKVLPRHLEAEPVSRERFLRSIRTHMKAGGHPQIAGVLDVGEWHGSLYLVMEYVPGIDLSRYLAKRHPLNCFECLRMIRDAALGLAHAHEQGLVHRDIKPSNLIRTPAGRVKILDWGLVRHFEAEQPGFGATQERQPLGTADYMAPEQFRDARLVDARADLYSLGCTLYQLLNRYPPFHEHTSFSAKLLAHATIAPPRLTRLGTEIPASVGSLVERLLSKSPDERPPSAQALITELDTILGSEEKLENEQPADITSTSSFSGALLSSTKNADSPVSAQPRLSSSSEQESAVTTRKLGLELKASNAILGSKGCLLSVSVTLVATLLIAVLGKRVLFVPGDSAASQVLIAHAEKDWEEARHKFERKDYVGARKSLNRIPPEIAQGARWPKPEYAQPESLRSRIAFREEAASLLDDFSRLKENENDTSQEWAAIAKRAEALQQKFKSQSEPEDVLELSRCESALTTAKRKLALAEEAELAWSNARDRFQNGDFAASQKFLESIPAEAPFDSRRQNEQRSLRRQLNASVIVNLNPRQLPKPAFVDRNPKPSPRTQLEPASSGPFVGIARFWTLPSSASNETATLALFKEPPGDTLDVKLSSSLADVGEANEFVAVATDSESRAWDICYRTNRNATAAHDVKIGSMKLADNAFTFKWETSGEGLPYRQLANCQLLLTLGKVSQTVQLRVPTRGKTVKVDLAEADRARELEIEEMPKSSSLAFIVDDLVGFPEMAWYRGASNPMTVGKEGSIEFTGIPLAIDVKLAGSAAGAAITLSRVYTADGLRLPLTDKLVQSFAESAKLLREQDRVVSHLQRELKHFTEQIQRQSSPPSTDTNEPAKGEEAIQQLKERLQAAKRKLDGMLVQRVELQARAAAYSLIRKSMGTTAIKMRVVALPADGEPLILAELAEE